MNTFPVAQLKQFRDEITRFMMLYKFALAELETKVEILQEEFQLLHDYNPIEHTKSRLKSPESILNKIRRKNCMFSLPEIRRNIKDIAGLRITCSFISDIYRIRDMLLSQSDLTLIEEKDYIERPKGNGYRSLHLLVGVPVFMSDREEQVCVEIQIRTIAMDFWASLEHKIYYKYEETVPSRLTEELKEAAEAAFYLDKKMERLQDEISQIKSEREDELELKLGQLLGQAAPLQISPELLRLFSGSE
ncbi:GTP pyrophosphokinase [Cohnella thailandensis]|uniref:GTP pyrophosphokinase family protein n=1 Tax=Cohnella thailandensis TaxID=557557 RepID=A0A841T4Z6_9BACL|nr:GTP pyrophosphokinase family protein [Cohnella thailandensis]MBB6636927.1 GTP pyrophosphokinase family protein [Cohnella thailandensis]MBP1973191.1 putative GTP pyrophosphokinase [Cohnella thailandensis]